MSKQIRDLVHTIKSKDLTGSQIESAFGEIFLSRDTIPNQLEAQEIVAQVQIVKSPYYGVAIPNTTQIISLTGDSGVVPFFTPASNKTYSLIAADLVNGSGAGMTGVLGLYDGTNFVKISEATPSSGGGQGGFNLRNAFTFDSSVYPALLITSGTAAQAVAQIAICELVQ